MGKQEYPGDVLAPARWMMDFVPGTGVTKRRSKPPEPMDLAFTKTKTRGGFNPICYCCSKRHPGELLKYHIDHYASSHC